MGKKIGLVVKHEDRALAQADTFERWLRARNITVIRRQSKEAEANQIIAPDRLFCVFVLGGDGTFLSAVRWLDTHQAPILGVKFGEVGFLAEITEERLYDVAGAILESQFRLRLQTRLDVRVFRSTPQAIETRSFNAFNDVVINKGALARLARIRTHINDQFLTDYRADGLIIATPTGSTAYSLAAGGPIIHPSVPGILITPICPFTLTNRPLMVPDDSVITIRLAESASDIMLTCDGQVGMKVDGEDTICIRKSPDPVQMITLADHNYFDVLKAKLKWG